jgi:DNA primase
VVGFGARRLFDDDPIEAKYLNTPETPLYKKSNVLYGIDVAKRDIARRRQAVVVEGYTDVMACHLAGVETAVATCGTAFGAEHTGILRRLLMDSSEFRGEVIFTFDGDAAGQAAALRAFEDEQRFVLQTFVAVEPSGLDPCDLRLSKGDAAVRDLVARRQPLVQFALRAVVQKYDLDTTEGRMAALDAAAPLVAKVKDSAMRNRYAVDLDRYLGLLNEQFVLARVAEIAGRGGARRPARVAAPEQDARPRPDDPTLLVEREVLKVAIQIPQLAGPMFDTLEEPAFTHPTYLTIRQGIAAAGGCAAGRTGADWVERISEHCPDLVTRSVLTELAVEQMHTHNEPDGRYVAAQVAQLRGPLVDRQIGALKSKLQRTNPLEQPDDYTRLFGELVGLEQFRHGLREQAIGAL